MPFATSLVANKNREQHRDPLCRNKDEKNNLNISGQFYTS